MQNRSPIAVFLLSMVTGGLYSWYWLVRTKTEMNNLGEKIPTAWIWLIPCVGTIWWMWKYSEGVEHVTNNKISGVLAFVLLFLLGTIGEAILQNYFNEDVAVASAQPMQPTYAAPAQSYNPVQQPIQQQPAYQQPIQPMQQPVYQQPVEQQPQQPNDQSQTPYQQ